MAYFGPVTLVRRPDIFIGNCGRHILISGMCRTSVIISNECLSHLGRRLVDFVIAALARCFVGITLRGTASRGNAILLFVALVKGHAEMWRDVVFVILQPRGNWSGLFRFGVVLGREAARTLTVSVLPTAEAHGTHCRDNVIFLLNSLSSASLIHIYVISVMVEDFGY